jgi:hypothetical protein
MRRLAILALLLSSCGDPVPLDNGVMAVAAIKCPTGTTRHGNQCIPTPAPTPSPTPTPTPTPAPTPTPTPAPDFPGDPTIADNWDSQSALGTGFTATKEDMGSGAWRIMATAGQLLYDDPIFYPGQPGKSHLHQFFCNTGANAYSTYQSLRTTGGTTCGRSPFIRSAAWFPAMLDGVGNVVKPDYIKLYYKRNSVYDPMCQDITPPHLGKCTPLPNGLRLVWGAHPGTGDTFPDGTVWFSCAPSDDGTVGTGTAGTGKYQSISEVAAAGCPVGAQLVIAANSPSCWDGVNLDSADHRSHMAYATGVWTAPQLFPACPADHPYPVPNVELLVQFTVDGNLATWHPSSDEMDPSWPNIPHGKTMHADYAEGWSPLAKAKMEACLNGPYSASSGAFCDGTGIPGGDVPWDCCNGTPGWQRHVVVPVPINPITGTTKPPM